MGICRTNPLSLNPWFAFFFFLNNTKAQSKEFVCTPEYAVHKESSSAHQVKCLMAILIFFDFLLTNLL